jgi:hypothetical protein
MATDEAPAQLIAGAAAASSAETADAIDRAADKNEDPEVAAILDDAALNADKTASRVSWLRRIVDRLFSRPD